MADRCPFVNQDHACCNRKMSIGDLSHAFGHCFADYATCPNYAALLGERRAKREAARKPEVGVPAVLTIAGQPAQTVAA